MTDLLVVAASNGENLKLAVRFAAAAQAQGNSAEGIDLTAIELPLSTPRGMATGTGPTLANLQQHPVGAPRWVICAPEYNGSIPPVLTSANRAKDDSINDLLRRLQHLAVSRP